MNYKIIENLPTSKDYKSILLNKTPLIDVRAKVEFDKGAIPNSTNIPILDDEQRHLVGIEYKENGNQKAVELGRKLVDEKLQKQRVSEWSKFKKSNPKAMIYCFRGGQRSKISQSWIKENGVDITRIEGGYKAFRNYLIKEIDESTNSFEPLVVGGRTGSGKTIFLKQFENMIDLEGLANHKGSSFGRSLIQQPSQINFENNLGYELVSKINKGYKKILFEHESKMIGDVYIPSVFLQNINKSSLIILQKDLEERIEITYKEYIEQAQQEFKEYGYENYIQEFGNTIQGSITRIRRKLGQERHEKVSGIFAKAIQEQISNNNEINDKAKGYFKQTIEFLLNQYYDSMYDYQIEKNKERIVFTGNEKEVKEFISATN